MRDQRKQPDHHAKFYHDCLQEIFVHSSVIACLIVALDGTVIADRERINEKIDIEWLALTALGLFLSAEVVIKKLGHDRLFQYVFKTAQAQFVIAEIEGKLLVIVLNKAEAASLIPPMRTVTRIMADAPKH